MPDIGKTIRDEISRLAKKEAKAIAQPLVQQVRDLKQRLRDQDGQLSELKKRVARKVDRPARVVPKETDDEDAIRIPKGSIRKHRERLGLTQKEMALLLGVSAITVGNWESGKAAPRGQNRAAFARLRELGVREAGQRLEALTGK